MKRKKITEKDRFVPTPYGLQLECAYDDKLEYLLKYIECYGYFSECKVKEEKKNYHRLIIKTLRSIAYELMFNGEYDEDIDFYWED